MQQVILPNRSAYITLGIIMLPFLIYGVAAIYNEVIWYGVIAILFYIFVVGYLSTMRLNAKTGEIKLTRFGITVWVIESNFIQISSENVGIFGNLPGYRFFCSDGSQKGYVLNSWFRKKDIDYALSVASGREN